jgi:hypothetical protein
MADDWFYGIVCQMVSWLPHKYTYSAARKKEPMKLTPHQRFKRDAAILRDKMRKMRETMRDADIARKLGITRQAVNSAIGPRKRMEKNQSD